MTNKGKLFFGVILLEALILFVLMGHGHIRLHMEGRKLLEAKKSLVSRLGLTDFALWTEARYTRHPSQTDFFSPFQEFPGSLEHFPAGTIVFPPRHFKGGPE